MPGFDKARSFVLLDHKPGSIFRWLQSLDFPSLAFVVLDPLVTAPEYPLTEVRKQLDQLEIAKDEDIIALAICTVPPPPGSPTANLMAPIAIGLTSRQGAQVILHEGNYSARHEFLAQRAA